MKFLNIFSKPKKAEEPKPEQEEELRASVTYSMDTNGEIYVDVNLSDFDEVSLDALSTIISMLSTVKCTH